MTTLIVWTTAIVTILYIIRAIYKAGWKSGWDCCWYHHKTHPDNYCDPSERWKKRKE